ncbi:hypothetical protein [Hugenholtzia roseola]|nr:hypothetical protein [Hugenholtzia roseola]
MCFRNSSDSKPFLSQQTQEKAQKQTLLDQNPHRLDKSASAFDLAKNAF